MKFSLHKETRQGGRKDNQDRLGYAFTEKSLLLIACDGMGGHLHGEVAAQYVMEYVARAFRSWANPEIKDPKLFLTSAIQGAHEGIGEYALAEKMKETPRTTCVACIIQGGKIWGANVGDSRFYHLRDGVILFQSTDHSYVRMLVEKGRISEDEAQTHPEKHKIYNCIGQDTRPKIDIFGANKIVQKDVVVLATDGFWGPLPDSLICATFSSSDVSVAIPMLSNVSESITGRSSDNLSAVGVRYIETSDRIEVVSGESEDECVITDRHLEAAIESIRLAIR
jgi:serine/threonine protein phosphatase PrpC